VEVSLSLSENFPLEPRTHTTGTGNGTATNHRQIERRAGYSAPGRADGLIVFDHKGRLVKADTRAATMLSAIGVDLDGSPRFRIDALDAADCSPADERDLPDWLHPDWIEPVVDGNERLGTVVQIPERYASGSGLQQNGLPQYKLRRVRRFIEAHIDKTIRLEDLAASAALSPFHFHREFKRSTGMTPHRYIMHVRMEHAKRLLSSSDMPLAEVAAQVGFADQSHFSANFRKATSMTPLRYRNALRVA
jgi:AraC-like DNA-binding protein